VDLQALQQADAKLTSQRNYLNTELSSRQAALQAQLSKARAEEAGSQQDITRLLDEKRQLASRQGCGSGLDPDSVTFWIRIRIQVQENEAISVEKCTF
jgi:hypothetical protein